MILLFRGDFMQNKFIPEKNHKKVITVRLDSELINTIDKIAFQVHVSRNEIIHQCIVFALNNLTKNDNN